MVLSFYKRISEQEWTEIMQENCKNWIDGRCIKKLAPAIDDLWENFIENKLDFFEWLAKNQETSLEWAREFINEIFNGKVIHLGDCTQHPCPCELCILEGLLEDYREYYFKK